MFKKAVQKLLWKLAGAEEVSTYFERKWYEEQLAHAETNLKLVQAKMETEVPQGATISIYTEKALEDFNNAYATVLMITTELDRRGW